MLPESADPAVDLTLDPADPVTRVAVLGSCVSRDVFATRFLPDYKDLYRCVALSNQVSFISLMDDAVDLGAQQLGDLSDYERREVLAETSRAFLAQLVEQRPHYVVVDLFADVHFGCVRWNDRWLTRNRWKLLKAKVYQDAVQAGEVTELTPTGDEQEYLRVWSQAVERFFAWLHAELPETKVVLHRARNVTRTLTADGEVRDLGNRAQLEAMNRWWDRLDDELQRGYVDHVIDVFHDDLASPHDHPWGPFAVHYPTTYHTTFLSKLSAIVVGDLRRRVAGLPPAPVPPPPAPAPTPSAGRRGARRLLSALGR
ncbi:MAG: DUF6270 domain-containing protein [Angustibacter sp.]